MSGHILSQDEFGALFENFQHSAFRLETLPQYLVEHETEEYQSFLNGTPLPPSRPSLDAWCTMVRKHIATGRTMSRVHVLPKKLTPYLRFEIEWGYVFTATAGEDVRFLLPEAPLSIRNSASKDFWLFDDSRLVNVIYEKDGRFVHGQLDDNPEEIAQAISIKNQTLEHSLSLRKYFKRIRQN